MNCRRIYFNLIRKRKKEIINNEHSQYCEKHHIIPRSLGGLDNKNNIVSLTAKEHYIAHLLLSKMFKYNEEKEIKMKFALIMMTVTSTLNNKRFNSNKFEQLRKNVGKLTSISQTGSKNSQFGKMWITNGLENKSIFKTDIIPDGWKKGRVPKEKDFIAIKNRIKYSLLSNKEMNTINSYVEYKNKVNEIKNNIKIKEKNIKDEKISYIIYLWNEFKTLNIGLREFCKIYSYEKSHTSLRNMFLRYTPEYKLYEKKYKKIGK